MAQIRLYTNVSVQCISTCVHRVPTHENVSGQEFLPMVSRAEARVACTTRTLARDQYNVHVLAKCSLLERSALCGGGANPIAGINIATMVALFAHVAGSLCIYTATLEVTRKRLAAITLRCAHNVIINLFL